MYKLIFNLFVRQKNRSTIKEITDTRTRSDAMKHEEDAKQRAGARHEEQQRKLDQTTQSKQNNVRAKQRQGNNECTYSFTILHTNVNVVVVCLCNTGQIC